MLESSSRIIILQTLSTTPTQETADTSSPNKEQEEEKGPLVVVPYAAGISEDIRHVCRGFKIRIVLKSGRTRRSMLTKVKDTLRSNRYIVSCSQVFIGE